MRKSALWCPLLLAGCTMAPTYRQPGVAMSPVYGERLLPAVSAETGPLATETGWRVFFADDQLRTLIGTALDHNRDLAQSLARVAQARGQYGIQAAARLPTIEANAGASRSRQNAGLLGVSTGAGGFEVSQFTTDVGVSAFELDLWGRVRNLAEAERFRYLASAEGARAYRLSLIAQVAAAYYDIRAGEERIALAERTLAGRRDGLRLAKMRLDAGVTSTVDYDQSVLLLTQAQAELADLHRTTEQARNLLDVLVGVPVARDAVPDGPLDFEQQIRPLSAGLPSALLQSRPDIVQAEYALRGANADIGAARAEFFPNISLTGLFGFASQALGGLFDSGNRTWSFGGAVNLPIFDGGRRKGQLNVSQARADELTAAYQRTVQGAFQEVADALVARRRLAEQIVAQKATVEAQRRLSRVARMRYENGIAIYLEVLDADRNLFSAEQQLLKLRATTVQNGVSLYVALGGGMVEG